MCHDTETDSAAHLPIQWVLTAYPWRIKPPKPDSGHIPQPNTNIQNVCLCTSLCHVHLGHRVIHTDMVYRHRSISAFTIYVRDYSIFKCKIEYCFEFVPHTYLAFVDSVKCIIISLTLHRKRSNKNDKESAHKMGSSHLASYCSRI
jgi:hypothetical protein